MSVRLVIDMNLSVEWVTELPQHGWSAVHWSTIGDPHADDSVIMAWALANGYAVFTHDLDFGTMLALTHATGPSVLQVRGQNVLPETIGPVVMAALRQHDSDLAAGALVTVDVKSSRVRVLPLQEMPTKMPNTFHYEVILYWSDSDQAFIAEVPELPGCAADGASYQEALAAVEAVINEWIETATELGREIPKPRGRLIYA